MLSKALQSSRCIAKSFVTNSVDFRLRMYKTHVLSLLDYGSVVWNPSNVADTVKLESVQRAFTKSLPGFTDFNYLDRCRLLGLQPLVKRRLIRDLVYLFNLLNANFGNLDYSRLAKIVADGRTRRNHHLKIFKEAAGSKRSSFLTDRVLEVWNKLSSITVSSTTGNQFESNLHEDYHIIDNFISSKFPNLFS